VVSVLVVEAMTGFVAVFFFFFEDLVPGPGILVQLTVWRQNRMTKPNDRTQNSNRTKPKADVDQTDDTEKKCCVTRGSGK
jgi:hypothetical protein